MGTMALGWMTMAAVSDRTARRPSVDFASVPPSQWLMHDRLVNWSRWCRGGSGESARMEGASPMFRLYRSSDARRDYGEETSVPIDKLDAQRVAKGVAVLPVKHRKAIQWHYLNGRAPTQAARELAVSHQGLADLVKAARTILMNRGV